MSNYMLIIKDGKIENNLSTEDIFNYHKYNTFNGVTYSTSAKFINHYLTKFRHINLTIGTNGDENNNKIYNAFRPVNYNLTQNLRKLLKHSMINLYQNLSVYSKKLLYAQTFNLQVPLTKIIHCKFYLLSNPKTNNTRIILGSANLSKRAFDNKQFEDLIILDNSNLFK